MAEYWTDYPLEEFGDAPHMKAPIRKAVPVSYDGDKYVTCLVHGVTVTFKAGYLYPREQRCGDGPAIDIRALAELPLTQEPS